MCPVVLCAPNETADELSWFQPTAVDPLDELRARETLPAVVADRPPIELSVWRMHVQYERERDPAVRDELFAHYAGYAGNLAASMHRPGGTPLEELEQVAYEALLTALDRFEVERRLPFEAFARPTIIGTIKRYFRDQGWAIRVPRRVHEVAAPTRDATERLTQKLARVPLVDEVAQAVGISADLTREVIDATQRRSMVAMDKPVGEGDGQDGWSQLGTVDAGYATVDNRLALGTALAQLTDEERDLVRWYFDDGLTQEQIGDRMGISQMQVSRLLRNIIRRLRVDICAEG